MSSEDRILWISAGLTAAVFAAAGILAGPGTAAGWALTIAAGPVAVAVVAAAWAVQERRNRTEADHG
ncbi:hypothetical protein [Streptomyces sp. B21-083]|uniref:hypothetical protein n=1 Tax=Streptomyces sp. B21-083 TaxID=3039410 RepID=UPI002FF118B1